MRALVLGLIAGAGLLVALVSGYFLLQDWAALKVAYARFEGLAAGQADLRALFAAEANQNIHRTNMSAEGIWMLLGAILAAIGIHGLCLLSRGKPAPAGRLREEP